MSYLKNSDGMSLVPWEVPAEAETDHQRWRRRYQQGRCVACGSTARYGKKALCRSCWEAGQRSCAGCERLVSLTEWRERARVCATCKSAIEGRRRNWRPDGKRQAGLKTTAILRARGRERATHAHHLRERGWN